MSMRLQCISLSWLQLFLGTSIMWISLSVRRWVLRPDGPLNGLDRIAYFEQPSSFNERRALRRMYVMIKRGSDGPVTVLYISRRCTIETQGRPFRCSFTPENISQLVHPLQWPPMKCTRTFLPPSLRSTGVS
jgi:hypothetical protein